MKVAIFENEYTEIEGAFNYLNLKYFSNTLIFEVYPRSQQFENINLLEDYGLVIIDIDLSSMSDLDGFGLIKLIESSLKKVPKLLILTGHEIIEDYDKKYNINKYPYLEKPINFQKLKSEFDKLNIVKSSIL